MEQLRLTRRGALLGLTAAFTLGRTSLALAQAPGDNRFVVVILRGAMDGLSAVQAYGDPDFAALRGELALGQPGGAAGSVLDLGGFYGLHPALAQMHALYAAGDVLVLHAVAGAYRSRSHFEAQDYMESGAERRLTSGWLNRAVAAMPAGGRGPAGQDLAVNMGLDAPLLLRGPARVQEWAPAHFGQAPSADLYARLAALTDHDALLGPALREALQRNGLGDDPGAGIKARPEVVLAGAAGRLLAAPDGPRVAVFEIGGWDTHVAQTERLGKQLAILDAAIAALHENLGASWRQTAVLTMTEFGRTARINGTRGTDHGTAGVAFLAGGAVAGGRVRADWPGLSPGRLFENRDLAPTADLRSVAKGVLAQHMGLSGAALDQVFPDSTQAAPMAGLLRA